MQEHLVLLTIPQKKDVWGSIGTTSACLWGRFSFRMRMNDRLSPSNMLASAGKVTGFFVVDHRRFVVCLDR
jgi:hypothetical protein